MIKDFESNHDSLPEAFDVEALVRSAGHYVVVSDDLRPQTMESALEGQRITTTRWRLSYLALAAVLFLALFSPMVRSTEDHGSKLASPTSAEVHQAALQYAAESNITSDWALQEVFADLRRSQAQRIRHSTQ